MRTERHLPVPPGSLERVRLEPGRVVGARFDARRSVALRDRRWRRRGKSEAPGARERVADGHDSGGGGGGSGGAAATGLGQPGANL